MPLKSTSKDRHKRKRLVDVDVTHVSLVDRPANQTPFKFVKRDEGTDTKGAFPMNITLKNLFGSRDPEVTSVIADTKHKAVELAKALIEGSEATLEEKDGVYIARKAGTQPSPEERAFHMGKSVGVVYTVANLQKELVLYDNDSMDFGDTVQKEGFVPGLYTATEALHTTIRNIAMDEGTKSAADFQTRIEKALSDFNDYVTSLAGALPETAFKFEKALTVIAPNDLGALKPVEGGFNGAVYDAIFGDPDAKPGDKADASDTAEGAADAGSAADAGGGTPAQADAAPAPAQSAGDTADATNTGEAPAATGETPATADAGANAGDDAGKGAGEAEEASGGASDEEPAPANLQELPKGTEVQAGTDPNEVLAQALAGLTENIGEQLTKALAPINERLAAQEATAAKLSKAMGSAVASDPDEDDNIIELRKNDALAGDPPLMDTAYRTRNKG